jgi:hypothetical protein
MEKCNSDVGILEEIPPQSRKFAGFRYTQYFCDF